MPVRQWLRGLCLGAAAAFLALTVAQTHAANNEASEARMRRDIFFLASDECEGRGPETKGINKAADYIANEFKKAGLKPGGPGGSYFQPFTIPRSAGKLRGPGTLTLRGPQGQVLHLKAGVDFNVTGGSGGGKVDAGLVFAGFGAISSAEKYNDYKGLDVAGKVVVVIRRVPRWNSKELPFGGSEDEKTKLAGLLPKFTNAESFRAAAVLLVNDTSDEPADKIETQVRGYGTVAIPVLHVKRSVLDPVLRSSLGSGLGDLERDISRDLKPRGAALRGWTARLEVDLDRPTWAVKNVIGVLEGSGPLANETVVVGAHYDHLGYGSFGSLASKKEREQKLIHHGADDNGSGSTSVMELARRFAEMKGRQGRRLVFMTFSGEERGLLGSQFYCRQPQFPLADTVAMVNLDMVGRLADKKNKLIVEGLGTAKGFDKLIDKLNEKYEFTLVKKQGGTGPSDHDSFYRKDIPVFFLWTGIHSDYHRPSDTADKIDVPGMRKIADLTEDIIKRLAGEEKRPQFVAVKGTTGPRPQPGKTPRLGIRPSYEDEKDGVLLDGVAEDGPAAKAGLKAGDRIVELGGRAVRNLNGFMVLMAQQQPGRPMEVGVLRDGKKMTLKVTPQ